jgi:hypothetical protein
VRHATLPLLLGALFAYSYLQGRKDGRAESQTRSRLQGFDEGADFYRQQVKAARARAQ